MRRSQAPSMRKAAKMGATACELNVDKKNYAPTEIQWGSVGGFKGFRPQKYNEGVNPLGDKRIFLVLWRKQSNKKHKTWKGNGTLEVTATKATLKDEIGKVMDVLTCFKPEKLHIDALLEFGMRDVEIQEELKTPEECIAQRKEEIENWYRQQEESDGLISTACTPQRPMNLLRKSKLSLESKSHDKSDNMQKDVPRCKLNEYICMLAPAELQLQTIQLLTDYCQNMGTAILPSESTQIREIATRICDHPVLLKDMESQPLLSEVLLPHLPPWHEMGLYDSAKFEFVHLMLDSLVVGRNEKCAIVATSQMSLDIIKGYCQCYDIACMQLKDNMQATVFNTSTIENEAAEPMVVLIIASDLETIRLTSYRHIILYNYSAQDNTKQSLIDDADTQIYTLITAGCLEERQFQQHLGIVDSGNSLMNSLRLRVNPTHELLEAQEHILASWNQWQPPFSESFLKETFYCDELPSLRFVFSKQSNIFSKEY